MNTSIKSFFNDTKVQIAILICTVVIGGIIINDQRSKNKYLDESCPRCGSCEVLDFGWDERIGGQHGHCPDCDCDFYLHCNDIDVTY